MYCSNRLCHFGRLKNYTLESGASAKHILILEIGICLFIFESSLLQNAKDLGCFLQSHL